MGQDKVIILEPGKEKCIVMPFQPGPGQAADGTGLGLHFLIGNLICLHQDLLECWFGWRVKKIFPDLQGLENYCQGVSSIEELADLGQQEKVRFWITGTYSGFPDQPKLVLTLHDTGNGSRYQEIFVPDFSGQLLGFRANFYAWLEQTGLGFTGHPFGNWPERITPAGLDLLGRALGALYQTYVAESDLDLGDFHAAVAASPEAYLTQDLLGWGLYKNGDVEGAARAFDRAVELNPDGMGAFAGLMWIALAREDREKALAFALEKGRCRGEDPEKAQSFVAKKLG